MQHSAAPVDQPPQQQRRSSHPSSTGILLAPSPAEVHVLVVDSSASSRHTLVQLLRDCGYQVKSVKTSTQALQLLSGHARRRYDILLKSHDPGGPSGGSDACRLLRRMPAELASTLPVIVVSANDDREVMTKCLTLGAIDYLVTPLRTNELRHIWSRVWLWRSGLPPRGAGQRSSGPADASSDSSIATTCSDDEEEEDPTSKEGSAPGIGNSGNSDSGNNVGSNGDGNNGASRAEASEFDAAGMANGSSANKQRCEGNAGSATPTERNALVNTAEGKAPPNMAPGRSFRPFSSDVAVNHKRTAAAALSDPPQQHGSAAPRRLGQAGDAASPRSATAMTSNGPAGTHPGNLSNPSNHDASEDTVYSSGGHPRPQQYTPPHSDSGLAAAAGTAQAGSAAVASAGVGASTSPAAAQHAAVASQQHHHHHHHHHHRQQDKQHRRSNLGIASAATTAADAPTFAGREAWSPSVAAGAATRTSNGTGAMSPGSAATVRGAQGFGASRGSLARGTSGMLPSASLPDAPASTSPRSSNGPRSTALQGQAQTLTVGQEGPGHSHQPSNATAPAAGGAAAATSAGNAYAAAAAAAAAAGPWGPQASMMHMVHPQQAAMAGQYAAAAAGLHPYGALMGLPPHVLQQLNPQMLQAMFPTMPHLPGHAPKATDSGATAASAAATPAMTNAEAAYAAQGLAAQQQQQQQQQEHAQRYHQMMMHYLHGQSMAGSLHQQQQQQQAAAAAAAAGAAGLYHSQAVGAMPPGVMYPHPHQQMYFINPMSHQAAMMYSQPPLAAAAAAPGAGADAERAAAATAAAASRPLDKIIPAISGGQQAVKVEAPSFGFGRPGLANGSAAAAAAAAYSQAVAANAAAAQPSSQPMYGFGQLPPPPALVTGLGPTGAVQATTPTGMDTTDSGSLGSGLMWAPLGAHGMAQQTMPRMSVALDPSRKRALALERYRNKRQKLKFGKVIRYESRKQLAQQRPRVKGQFVKRVSSGEGASAEPAEGGASGVAAIERSGSMPLGHSAQSGQDLEEVDTLSRSTGRGSHADEGDEVQGRNGSSGIDMPVPAFAAAMHGKGFHAASRMQVHGNGRQVARLDNLPGTQGSPGGASGPRKEEEDEERDVVNSLRQLRQAPAREAAGAWALFHSR